MHGLRVCGRESRPKGFSLCCWRIEPIPLHSHLAPPTEEAATNDNQRFRWIVLPITLWSLLGGRTAAADVAAGWNVSAVFSESEL
jgi:hypothetical protein